MYRSIGRPAGRYAAAHLLFAAVLAGAVAVRIMAARGYPSLLWGGDSYGYLDAANKFRPHIGRPSGYSVFLAALGPFEDFRAVVFAQAALGVAAGAMVYALVWRAARRAWPRWIWLPGLLAAPASVPMLYDGNLIQAEHMMLADSLFTFLLVAAVTVVLWGERTPWWAGAVAGLLTSFAALTRLAGLPLLGLIVLAMLLRRPGWRRAVASVAAAVVMFAVPFGAYMNWFSGHWGGFALTKADKVWLYGRTVDFADCAKLNPPPELIVMCPKPASDPRIAPAFRALWTQDSPFTYIPGGIYGDEGNQKAGEFADLAIKKQFGDYVGVIVRDTLRAFESGREPYPTPWTEENTRFPAGEAWSDDQQLLAEKYGAHGRGTVVEPHAAWIRGYHDRWFTPGPALAGLLVVGLAGVLIRLRPRSGFGGAVLLPWSMAAALVVIPAATADFDYRYLPPAVPFACLAAVLALIPGAARTRPAAAAPAVPADEPADDEPDESDESDESGKKVSL
ncbi:glycosyltransferase family 87 protein [Actinomadura vinacea]|uniref:ArnT family glycosyltransferase n=1 Tax=Actinomadura vinacea TaxID=115336 RepID=UPI0031D936B7